MNSVSAFVQSSYKFNIYKTINSGFEKIINIHIVLFL